MKRGVLGGAVFAVLWLGSGWISYALASAGGSFGTLALLVPSPGGRGVFGSPLPWAVLVQVLIALALVAGFAALAPRLSARSEAGGADPSVDSVRGGFTGGWLAAILVAFAIGAAQDIGSFLVWVGSFGMQGALRTMGVAAMTTWWAVAVGWIPALVWARSRRRVSAPATANAPRMRSAVISVIAVIALVLVPVATEAANAATQQQLRDDQSASGAPADPDGAADPDPSASGEPVPTAAPGGDEVAADACTAENTTILAPGPDGATGHRAQHLQLVNVSEEPCTVEGYPDVAYGDQNGHLLDVAVEHGRSFMAEDPGATLVTLQPGESAAAAIGWDANSVHGQLAARSLWIAVHPGQLRLSWDVSLDIVPGVTVHVTAWHLAPPPAG